MFYSLFDNALPLVFFFRDIVVCGNISFTADKTHAAVSSELFELLAKQRVLLRRRCTDLGEIRNIRWNRLRRSSFAFINALVARGNDFWIFDVWLGRKGYPPQERKCTYQ